MTRQPPFEIRGEGDDKWLAVRVRGADLQRNAILNKSSSFPDDERDAFQMHGLLPPRVTTIEEQVDRVMKSFARPCTDLDRYVDLMSLLNRNETLFYRVLAEHVERMMPIVYTPTVGEACQKFGDIFRQGRGLFITAADTDRIDEILGNWPYDDVSVVVVTDGERILGLGDLGSGGMGIGIGKLSLYVAAAGIHPAATLPICLDVGTNNKALREDPLYLGVAAPRVRGEAYERLLDNFMEAVSRRYPDAVIQFEDFSTPNAIRLLERYRDRYRCFNDDIQGTAAVAAAGVIAAVARHHSRLVDQRIVFAGAGGSATGIATIIASAMKRAGLSDAQALEQFWFCDSQGLTHAGRDDLADHKLRFARSAEEAARIAAASGGTSLVDVVRGAKPTVLIGASGQPGIFDEAVIAALAEGAGHPVVFMLSNPTSRAECTPEQAIRWSRGRATVATGSPFDPVEYEGRTRRIGQANNVFIFPGLGLGVLAVKARRIPEELFLAAMTALGELAPADALYPAIADIRSVSRDLAVAVGKEAIKLGLTEGVAEADVEARVDALIWEPCYRPYRPI